MIKNFLKYTTVAAMLCTMLPAVPAFANPDDTPVTEGQIEETKEQINDFESKVQQLDNQIIIAMDNSQKLNEQITSQQEKIEETEAEILKANEAFENHKSVYSERLKSIQLKGSPSIVTYAELLISSTSVSEFFNRFTAISQFIESDTEMLNGLKTKEKSLKEAEEQLHNQFDQLKKSQEKLAAEQKKIEEDKKQIVQALAEARNNLQNQQSQLAQQEAERQAAEAAAAALQLAPAEVQQTEQPSDSTPSVAASNISASGTASSVIATAKQYLGVPYVWGGTTPSGFDCSGFVQYVYRSVGISLPRVSRDQQKVGKRISPSQVQPGDLVFNGSPAYHVGIYIGGGQYIHAPQTGDVVKIASYNPSRFSSAARVLP